MRKCLVLAALLLVSQLNYIKAQDLFSAPDTVCIRQPVYLTDSVAIADSYYWGFCSGYLFNTPVGYNPGTAFNSTPGAIEVAKDAGNYYAFIAVAGTAEDTLLRLDFGNSLSNTPDTINFGTLSGTMPINTAKLNLIRTNNNWYMFACGGNTQATSSIARLDFGTTLSNTPNSVNFGNASNLLNGPRGIFVQQEGSLYYGYLVNALDNHLIRLDFGNNISLTPVQNDLNNIYGFSIPSDIAPVYDGGNWYMFVTNIGTNEVTRLDLGPSLTNAAIATNIGDFGGKVFGPSGITYVKDCGSMHLFISNGLSSDVMRVDMPSPIGPFTGANFTGVGGVSSPVGVSHVIRERDSVFLFVVNSAGNSLSQIIFPQCTNASITSSEAQTPPSYSYNTPGIYNVYFIVNEGQPTMQVQCKQIVALPIPPLTLSHDTLICQGDTIDIFAQSITALSYSWSPNYNITDTGNVLAVKVWPEFSVDYHVVMPYANGCIVDTPVKVTVSKNKADAGPDRIIFDGASTVLGGPLTTEGPQYTYTWLPDQFINSTIITNPVAKPPYDFTYYLEVRNTQGCYDIDTVVIRVACNDLNLPNAFSPDSKNAGSNRFGILNKQIVKLNYFRIYDRWGKEVFNTTDITKQWDGTVNGELAPLGVYVWEADGFCSEGQRFKRSGNVTLIR